MIRLADAKPVQLGQFTYPNDRSFEGSAAYVASARIGGRDLALVSEADFIPSATTLVIDGTSPMGGTKFGCEAIFTLYDQTNRAQLYRQPDSRVDADLAYVGRGCPVSAGPDMMHSDMAVHGTSPTNIARADIRESVSGLLMRARTCPFSEAIVSVAPEIDIGRHDRFSSKSSVGFVDFMAVCLPVTRATGSFYQHNWTRHSAIVLGSQN